MGLPMSAPVENLPSFSNGLTPPLICGVGDLARFAYQGHDQASLIDRIDQFHGDRRGAARLYDLAIAAQLGFDRVEGLKMQVAALDQCQIYRLQEGSRRPAIRLLALSAPGDLMVNAPLDFITNEIDVRLDLLYLLPDRPLPDVIPDHDVAFFAVSEADPALLTRLIVLFDAWPRPVLNDPRFLPALARDTLANALSGVPGICSPPATLTTRAALEAGLCSATGAAFQPRLIRPAGSHAGAGLVLAASAEEMAEYLRLSPARDFVVTAFEDYAGPDGHYRKSRVAFIDRRPFLCHMAVSTHWMVHYLNAGMTEAAWKRDEEAAAMRDFDSGFARRHAAAFEALHDRLGFDYYSIDCAETRDGRLLVFEADVAAIIHLMDPADMFPYKHPQMRRVFEAFGAMLRRRLPPAVQAA
jgi:hypothetical protein